MDLNRYETREYKLCLYIPAKKLEFFARGLRNLKSMLCCILYMLYKINRLL